jgi:hypothetical protein
MSDLFDSTLELSHFTLEFVIIAGFADREPVYIVCINLILDFVLHARVVCFVLFLEAVDIV